MKILGSKTPHASEIDFYLSTTIISYTLAAESKTQ
jgi:hypothetical protein